MNTVKQILICDDVADDARLLEAILLADDCYIEIVDSAAAVLAFLKNSINLPDLIILDVLMPVMDGFEVASKIRQSDKFKDIPILLVTGWKEDFFDINNKKYIELKIDGYIQKPVDFDTVTYQVRKILD
ncbi:MAG: response regulator [Aulosira sp. ZfuVER01]|nr:response regulator [Aulosira sp. ZfuVER01]MDZ7997676.1 response regulator [Aulosira sp. DedVER01a]MDZ8055341.1 response regulator [Aulosira sp. ZfuCHP01]